MKDPVLNKKKIYLHTYKKKANANLEYKYSKLIIHNRSHDNVLEKCRAVGIGGEGCNLI